MAIRNTDTLITKDLTNNCAVISKKIAELVPDSRNANKGSPRGNQMIEDSLRQYGAGRSILLDKHGRIIAGNKTAENAGAIGMEDVLVVQSDGKRLVAVQRTDLDLDDPHTRQLAIADNRSGQVSLDWDADALKGLVEDGVDLAPFWTADELAAMWPQTVDLLTDEDDVPSVPAEPVSKLGDLYIMGDHRLLCGDSTCVTDVERLMGGAKADMVFTDPPYGVSIVNVRGQVSTGLPPDPALRRKSGTVGASKPFGKVETIDRGMKAKPIIEANVYPEIIGDDSTDTAVDAYTLCASLKIKVMIFWGGNYYADRLPASSAWLVWDKDNGQSFFGDGEIAWTNQKTAVRIFKHQWNGLIKASERGEKRVHPTQKPVALAEWCFEHYSEKEDKVLDLFGGSGSTLIACEKTGRKCYMMELSPAYCDVIVSRWEQATGKKAVLSAG
jgi:16S rRNA G966 N2-methylase RsmD